MSSDTGQEGQAGQPGEQVGVGGQGGRGGAGGDGGRGETGERGATGFTGSRGPAGSGEANEGVGAPRKDSTWFDRILHKIAPDLTRLRRIVFINAFMWVLLGTVLIARGNQVNQNTDRLRSSICAISNYANEQARTTRELALAANPENRALRLKQAAELAQLSRDIRAPGVECHNGK